MSLQERRDIVVLTEPSGTAESDALLEAFEAATSGRFRIVATCIVEEQLMRIVIDAHGDVLFASDALPTEDIVDLRRVARCVSHGSRQRVGAYDLLVEHLP
jgi:xanthine dehydrogenase accessory factor